MGQVYSTRSAGAGAIKGSRAMPHFGQGPGPSCRISGCIGQVKVLVLRLLSLASVFVCSGFVLPAPVKLPGDALNFSRQWVLQKRYVVPSFSRVAEGAEGSTSMPQTGSRNFCF